MICYFLTGQKYLHIYEPLNGRSSGPYTFTINTLLKENFRHTIRLNNVNPNGHYFYCFGFSDHVLDEQNGYLGQETGQGTWSTGLNKYICENGENKGQKEQKFGQNDTITLIGNNGVISFMINDRENDYSYNMNTTNLYIGFTVYYVGDQFEIIC